MKFGKFLTAALIFISGCQEACPPYNVYVQQQIGAAELARADSNRKIATLE